MKAVILAGGLGTRLAEETHLIPKPMVEIGGRPILWHVMKIYAEHGIKDFIICAGYKSEVIKNYFLNYRALTSDLRVDLGSGSLEIFNNRSEDWRVMIVDSGADTMTGGRLLHVAKYLDAGEDFCFTYGDGVGDVNIRDLVAFHRAHGSEATMTAALPPGRFGNINLSGNQVTSFREKHAEDTGHVNAGFFVLKPSVVSRIEGPATIWEREPLESLAGDGQLKAYLHNGFWQPMDTLRDKQLLEGLVAEDQAPWMTWR